MPTKIQSLNYLCAKVIIIRICFSIIVPSQQYVIFLQIEKRFLVSCLMFPLFGLKIQFIYWFSKDLSKESLGDRDLKTGQSKINF